MSFYDFIIIYLSKCISMTEYVGGDESHTFVTFNYLQTRLSLIITSDMLVI